MEKSIFNASQQAILNVLGEALPRMLLAPSLAGGESEAVEMLGFGRKLALVCDANTYEALGQRIERALAGRHALAVLMFRHSPGPIQAAARRIQAYAKSCDGLIAVGSGTMNDLCKVASYRLGRPYAVFPTAPSMNGYVSANASIIVSGGKKSLPAHMPAGVFCDLGVLAAAPLRLIRSGLGDSLCRSTAQADWLLSHLLLGTHYDERPFQLLLPEEKALHASAAAIAGGDRNAVALLMKTLLLSGFGMTLAGGSHPASQGEHMIAHAYEAGSAEHGRPANPMSRAGRSVPYHGEQIGVTTLTMARIQEALLARPVSIRPGKRLPESMKTLNARLQDGWQEMAARITQVAIPSTRLERVLKKIGAPRTPTALGWDSSAYGNAVRSARFQRDRFTFLDLQS